MRVCKLTKVVEEDREIWVDEGGFVHRSFEIIEKIDENTIMAKVYDSVTGDDLVKIKEKINEIIDAVNEAHGLNIERI